MIDYFRLLEGNFFADCKMMKMNECATKFFEIHFRGWTPQHITGDDKELEEILDLANLNIEFIISKYKETHSFSQPMFCYLPPMQFSVKIGVRENKKEKE
jgi:hypothetical protein